MKFFVCDCCGKIADDNFKMCPICKTIICKKCEHLTKSHCFYCGK